MTRPASALRRARALPPAAFASVLLTVVGAAPALAYETGDEVKAFAARDTAGKEHRLADYHGKKHVVLVVWGSRCPASRAYGERLEALRKRLAKDGTEEGAKDGGEVVLLALAPNRGETKESIEAARREAKLEVPVLLDPDGAIAKDLGAVTTPTAFLIDAEGRLRYQGAIDDDPQGKKPEGERTSYLADAVKAVLAGEAPKRAKVPATGFKIKF